MKCDISLEECFCGSATVGERGQVVIPAEARRKLNIQPGDKLIVMTPPNHAAIVLSKIDSIREVFSTMLEEVKKIESRVEQSEEEGVHSPGYQG